MKKKIYFFIFAFMILGILSASPAFAVAPIEKTQNRNIQISGETRQRFSTIKERQSAKKDGREKFERRTRGLHERFKIMEKKIEIITQKLEKNNRDTEEFRKKSGEFSKLLEKIQENLTSSGKAMDADDVKEIRRLTRKSRELFRETHQKANEIFSWLKTNTK